MWRKRIRHRMSPTGVSLWYQWTQPPGRKLPGVSRTEESISKTSKSRSHLRRYVDGATGYNSSSAGRWLKNLTASCTVILSVIRVCCTFPRPRRPGLGAPTLRNITSRSMPESEGRSKSPRVALRGSLILMAPWKATKVSVTHLCQPQQSPKAANASNINFGIGGLCTTGKAISHLARRSQEVMREGLNSGNRCCRYTTKCRKRYIGSPVW